MKIDFEKKEARFQPKKDASFDIEEVKKAVASSGRYEVTDVRPPKESKTPTK